MLSFKTAELEEHNAKLAIIVFATIMSIGGFFIYKIIGNVNRIILEEKQADDAIRKSEEKSLLLLNSTGEAIYGIDLDGNCTFCNTSCLHLLGYEEESQLLGRNMHDMIHHTRKDGTPYPVEECCIYQAFREGKGTRVDSEVLWRANGTSFPAEYQSFPIIREGKAIGSVVSFVDITERKIAENHIKSLNKTLELRVIERTAEVAKLSSAVEHSSSTVVITDTEGNIEYVNPSFTQTTGYTSEEAMGENPRILKSGEQGAEVYKELWDAITSGSEWKGEFHNKRNNGELYWELASISPIKDKDGVITNFVAVKEDITDRKRMEEELRTFNDLLGQRIAERTSELTNTIEKLKVENTMRMKAEEEVNIRNSYLKLHQISACAANEAKEISEGFLPVLKALCHTIGWPVGHAYLLSEDAHDCMSPTTTWYLEDNEKFAVFKKGTEKTSFSSGVGLPGRVMSSGKPEWIVDVTKVSDFPRTPIAKEVGIKSAFAFPVMVGTEVVAVLELFGTEAVEPDNNLLEIVTDIGKELGQIIERKQANEQLRKSEASLAEAQRIARIGNWEWNIVLDTLHWSNEIYRIFGLRPQELHPTYDKFLRLVHPADREFVKRSVNEAIYESVPYSIEHRIVLPDGTEREVHEHAEVTFDKDGIPIRMIGTIQDITEIKRGEEELIKAQKLDSIGILAGGIAHDFNNYLQGIMGYLLLAEAYTDTNDKVKKQLKEAQKIIFQSKELSQRLITFSKGGNPIRQTIIISQLLKDSVAIAMSASSFDCQVRVPDNLWPVEADKGQLNQVFSNLVINAKQAMPNGGKINVFAENVEINKNELCHLMEGKYVKTTFKDRGIGISNEDLQKIFDPYFTTKKSGNGLGLSTCFSIIKKHGGHISVESELGVGTTFHIYLPASVKETPEPGEVKTEGTEEASIESKGKVLLMDDDNILRRAVTEQLRHLKYDVEEAKDGTEAIALYKKGLDSDTPFDAIVTDLVVPGKMGGKEATKELLKIDPEAKVIVTSGYIDDSTMSEYKRFGFRDVLSKPYVIDELHEILQKIIIEKI